MSTLKKTTTVKRTMRTPPGKTIAFTGRGDTGMTSTYCGIKLPKTDGLFDAIGDLDELNVNVGICHIAVSAVLANHLADVESRRMDNFYKSVMKDGYNAYGVGHNEHTGYSDYRDNHNSQEATSSLVRTVSGILNPIPVTSSAAKLVTSATAETAHTLCTSSLDVGADAKATETTRQPSSVLSDAPSIPSARDITMTDELKDTLRIIRTIQNTLMNISSVLATKNTERRAALYNQAKIPEMIEMLETDLHLKNNRLPKLTNFVIPGVNAVESAMHVARVGARRCERHIIPYLFLESPPESSCAAMAVDLSSATAATQTTASLSAQTVTDEQKIITFMNRLSSYMFTAARYFALEQFTIKPADQKNNASSGLSLGADLIHKHGQF